MKKKVWLEPTAVYKGYWLVTDTGGRVYKNYIQADEIELIYEVCKDWLEGKQEAETEASKAKAEAEAEAEAMAQAEWEEDKNEQEK